MSHIKKLPSSSNTVQQNTDWAAPGQRNHSTAATDTDTAILPMYWVSGQWMVASSTSTRYPSNAIQDPSLVSLVPHIARPTLPTRPETLTTFSRTHQRQDPGSLGLPSTSAPSSQYLYRNSSEPMVESTSSVGQHSQAPLVASPSIRSTLNPTPTFSHQPIYHTSLPPKTAQWDYETRQRPLLNETRSDSRIANNYGERRHKAHLDSEKRRRESINFGLEALRQALPSTHATDSKAITLRKAVQYINHLKSRLQEPLREQVSFTGPNVTVDMNCVKGET